tara:strand:- start:549 stop:2282 length:1734 start_codon:yes stop_codon:yes gene_type:complete
MRYLFLILVSVLISNENYFLIDSLDLDIDKLLNYKKEAKNFQNKTEKANFFSDISFSFYDKTLNLQDNTVNIISQYNALINNLEERLSIDKTSVSYSLGAPLIDSHFKQIPVSRETIKNSLHYQQTESMKEQYLKLLRYRENIINLCEARVDELLLLLNENSIDKLFNDTQSDKSIVVMNFSNLSNNIKYDKFVSAFPDIIINRYKDRDDISVMYSGSIEPDLRDLMSNGSFSVKFLVDGSFMVDGYNITVNFKVYDINSWSLQADESLTCDIRDIDCVYDGFLWSLKQKVDPLIIFEDYSDFSDNKKKIINIDQIDKIVLSKKNKNLFEPLLESFAVQKDYSFDIDYQNMGIDDDPSIKTQTFDLSKYPNGIKSKKELLDDLLEKLTTYLENPYQIEVGDLNMTLNNYDNGYVDLSVPVNYKIKKRELDKVIKKMPYNTLDSKHQFYTIEFLYDDYLFDSKTISMFNKYQNELFPVLFFTNKDGNIQKILIDSWDSKYDNLLFGDYDVSRVDNFVQLYNLIGSDKDIHLNINKKTIDVMYQVTMPVSVLDNYTRLTVKVFKRSDLDAYLPISQFKF